MTDPHHHESPQSLELLGTGKSFQGELCGMIESTQMFRDFDWHDIQALAGYMQAYQADRDATLFGEGESGSYLCLIIEGKVDVVKADQKDQRKVVATIGPGKTLGEMAIVDGEPRSAAAIAAEPTTLAILTKSNFLRITTEKPALATKILLKVSRLLSQRLRQTSGILVDYLESESK
jgi:CRP-like cAMP-binding protein